MDELNLMVAQTGKEKIRDAAFEDCDDLGVIIVSAFFGTFLGQIPEQDLDFSWTPAVSAANWKRDFDDIRQSDCIFYVFESDDKVIAYLLASPGATTDGYQWSVDQLHVLPSKQGAGAGRALLSRLARALHQAGVKSLEIGCVRENPSCGFYRNLGGMQLGTRPANVDTYKTEEILFGWTDITALI